MTSDPKSLDLAQLAALIGARSAGANRYLVAIAGAPGSGKSTTAERLAARLGPVAAVLPMDGFHLDNAELTEMGLLHRKGAPETFDAAGFVALVARLRQPGDVRYPTFDRARDCTVPDAGQVDQTTRLLLIEGNYLLLDRQPWSDIGGLVDLTVRLAVPREVLQARLIQRWLDHGMSAEAARARALGNDMLNVDTVLEQSRVPDVLLNTDDG